MYSIITRNEEETAALGKRLGLLLLPGDFIALMGELGSGKTRFVQGVAAGLQIELDLKVTSPTYSLLHIHSGRIPLYHFDLYRLAGGEDVEELGFAEYFYGEGACLVEWSDRLHGEMPAERLIITFSHCGEDERRIDFAPAGKRYEELVMNFFP